MVKLLVTDLATGSQTAYRRRTAGRDVGVPRLGDLVSTGALFFPGEREPRPGLYGLVEQVLWSDELDTVTVTVTATAPDWAAMAPGLDRLWRPEARVAGAADPAE